MIITEDAAMFYVRRALRWVALMPALVATNFYVRLALGWFALMTANVLVGIFFAALLFGVDSVGSFSDLIIVLLVGGIINSALFWAGYGLYHLVRSH